MRRRTVLALFATQAACSGGMGEAPEDSATGEIIDCAPAGADVFGGNCTAEQVTDGGSTIVVVRNPDGDFHRFRIIDDGRGLEAADGARPLELEHAEGTVTVAIGDDRYVLPAPEADHHAGK